MAIYREETKVKVEEKWNLIIKSDFEKKWNSILKQEIKDKFGEGFDVFQALVNGDDTFFKYFQGYWARRKNDESTIKTLMRQGRY